MIPDERIRAMLRRHDEAIVSADPAFLGGLLGRLAIERRRARGRAAVVRQLQRLTIAAAVATVVVAVGAGGLILTGGLHPGDTAGPGGPTTRSPGATPTTSQAPSDDLPSPSPSSSPAVACELAWDIPPAKGPDEHNLFGHGFLPGAVVMLTESNANGSTSTDAYVADASGSVELGHYRWTDPLGQRDRGRYTWVATDGSCTASSEAEVR